MGDGKMRKIEEIIEKVLKHPNQKKVYIPWIIGLSALILAVTVISNCNLGNRQFRQEMGEHWHAPAPVSPMIRVAAPGGMAADSLEQTYNSIAQMLNQVSVSIKGSSVVNGNQTQLEGSGIIVGGQYVLTNFHVVEHATDIDVFTGPPAVAGYHAVVVQTDWANDLALLRIQTNQTLPSATFGNSDVVNSGDVVFAMGNAYGKGNIFTTGIISDRNQTFSVEGRIYRNMIRTDTYIYPGSSGGALADIHGQIIGINTAIYDPNGNFTGISFATPINRALGLLQSLQAQGPSGMYGPQAMGPASPPNNPGTPFSLAA